MDRVSLERKPVLLTLPRDLAITYDPFAFSAQQYRSIIARSPVVRSCIQTMVMQILSVPHLIRASDPGERRYYEQLMADFDNLIPLVVTDCLEVPFGGVIEPIRDSNGYLTSLVHVDGATVSPTYAPQYPYIQIDPENSMRRVLFPPNTIIRLQWSPITDMRAAGWTRTPVMDCLEAVQSLARISTYWNTLLSDTPAAGLLDLMDFDQAEAESWVASVQELYSGIHRMKIPIIYGHPEGHKAEFINFTRTPVELTLQEVMRRYVEFVTAAFGMSPADISLYVDEQTKAGITRLMSLSKRQGLGSMLTKIRTMLNSIFPSHVKFDWDFIDPDDNFRTERANRQRVASITDLVSKEIISPEEAKAQLQTDGLLSRGKEDSDPSLEPALQPYSWIERLLLEADPPDHLPDVKRYSVSLTRNLWDSHWVNLQTRSKGLDYEETYRSLQTLIEDFTANIISGLGRGEIPDLNYLHNNLANVLSYHTDISVNQALERSAPIGAIKHWHIDGQGCDICNSFTTPVPINEGYQGRPPCLCRGYLEIISPSSNKDLALKELE